jgi:hypothetical protein
MIDTINARECEYILRRELKCGKTPYETSPYCILHIELPNAYDPQYNKIKSDKDVKVREMMQNGDFDFEGAILPKIDLSSYRKLDKTIRFTDAIIKGDIILSMLEIDGGLIFTKAIICGNAAFNHVKVHNARFEGAEIDKDLDFRMAKIGRKEKVEIGWTEGIACFSRVKVGRDVWFKGATICKDVDFTQASIGRLALFGSDSDDNVAQIRGSVILKGTIVGEEVKFSERFIDNCPDSMGKAYDTGGFVDFRRAKISGNVSFIGAKILGDISFD